MAAWPLKEQKHQSVGLYGGKLAGKEAYKDGAVRHLERTGTPPGDREEEDQGNENKAEKRRQSTRDNEHYRSLNLAF